MLSNERKRPLLQPKLGAFFYAHFGPLGMTAEGGEDRHVGVDAKRIVAPMTGGDHPPVKVEDLHQLLALEGRDLPPLPFGGERRDDTQANFTFGWDWAGFFRALSSRRSSAISSSSSVRRARTGSTSSPQGVP